MESTKNNDDNNEVIIHDHVIDVNESHPLLKDDMFSNITMECNKERRSKHKVKTKRRPVKGFSKLPNLAKNAALIIQDKLKVSMVSFNPYILPVKIINTLSVIVKKEFPQD
uniref:Uncharacterized protein n=1 Tax=Strongyloides papillosus TaxID=174720 RepID=A0A0N5CDM3_STREA